MQNLFARIAAVCTDVFFPVRETERIVRTIPDSWGATAQDITILPGTPPITALLPYHDTEVRACVLETKFHGNTRAGSLLGKVLAEYFLSFVQDEGAFLTPPFVLIPLPLSKKRYRARGYNQSERIARAAFTVLPEMLHVDTTILKRIRDTTPQTSLGRAERLRNMHGAFGAVHSHSSSTSLSPHTPYIVLDDVATTGATLRAAYTALYAAGAREIHLLALAH